MSQLLPEERSKLHEALRAAFPRRSEFRMFLSLSCDISLDDIDDGASYAETVFNLIKWTESEGRTEDLVEKARIKKPKNKLLNDVGEWLLVELGKRSAESIPLPKDPFQAYLLRGGQPFVNRQVLRDHLRELASDNGSRILAVSGAPGSGKSYSINFISHIAYKTKQSRLIWIDIEQAARATFGPEQFVRSLVNQMGRRASVSLIPKQGASQEARWLIELRDWIVGEISQTEVVWWLVCDGLCHQDVPIDTRDLLRHLIKIAHVNVPQLRVIVLACTPEILPADLLPFIRQEDTVAISRPEVKDYFQRLVKDRIIRVDSAALDEAVKIVFENVPNGTATLAAALAEATKRLRKPA